MSCQYQDGYRRSLLALSHVSAGSTDGREGTGSIIGALACIRALNVLLPAVTSLLGFGFAGVLLARFAGRRQPYYLVWGLGLVWYAIAAGTEALGGAQGWTPALYRTWYITGAIGVAAFLGAGTLYLHREPASAR